MESTIATYLRDNPDWREKIYLEYNVEFKEKGELAIFTYNAEGIDWKKDLCREARGIIINTKTFEVVCWPYGKFFNWNEPWASVVDWETAEVQEKVDGSLIKLWYYDGEWRWSTNNVIDASDCKVNSLDLTFMELIERTKEYKNLDYDALNRDYTYMFELVSPENRVEVPYTETMLYHTGTRNCKTGEELKTYIGARQPKVYPICGERSLNAVRIMADKLNPDGELQYEGFVVVDKNFRRLKVKTEEYLHYSKILNNGSLSPKRILDFILDSTEEEIVVFCKNFPEYAYMARYMQYKYELFRRKAHIFTNRCRRLFEEFGYDRKTYALYMKGEKDTISFITFYCLNNNDTTDELLARVRRSVLLEEIEKTDISNAI